MFGAVAAALGVLFVLTSAVSVQAEPEKKKIVFGLPLHVVTYAPVYVAEREGYYADEGLDVEIASFGGAVNMVKGIVAGNADVSLTSLATIALAVKADQPLKVFYAGFNSPVFEWYAVKDITSFREARGRKVGISSLGTSSDYLTRYALQLNGLDPEKDVQIVTGGHAADRLSAMDTGQIEVNIIAKPAGYILRDRGYNKIYSQEEIAPDFPLHVFYAREDFIAANPETIRALLRATIRGIRKVKADKDAAVAAMVDRVGYEKRYSAEAYDDVVAQLYEDGRMPSQEGMKAFWEIGMLGGLYDEPWPEERYLDHTFIDSYAEWKPGD